jgi:hypothetical protein
LRLLDDIYQIILTTRTRLFLNIASNYGTLMRDFTIAILSQYYFTIISNISAATKGAHTPTAQIKIEILTV